MTLLYLIRPVSAILIAVLAIETLAPVAALALTGGPTQPEFSTFTPVSSSDLVTPFTGDFNYSLPVVNIPGPNGMGYALSLSYQSGATMEDEASWVGFGWSLNPGSITRMKRGFPDDYKGQEVTYWNNVPDNWTATVTKEAGLEMFSLQNLPDAFQQVEPDPGTVGPPSPAQVITRKAGLSGQMTHRYNNYRGYGYSWGLSTHVKGIGSLGYTERDDVGSFSYSINVAGIMGQLGFNVFDFLGIGTDGEKDQLNFLLKSMAQNAVTSALTQTQDRTGIFGMWNFNDFSMPVNTTEYEGTAIDFKAGLEADPFGLPVGPEVGLGGSYTVQRSVKKRNRSAYGFMYSGQAPNGDAAMDYYLEHEALYQKRDNFLSIPFSNADHFVASGEGIGGTFRLHHKKPGMFRPPQASSSTNTYSVNADIHVGGAFGIGGAFGFGHHALDVAGLDEFDDDGNYSFLPPGNSDEPFFFRFVDDLGGSVEMADNDEAVGAEIQTNMLMAFDGVATSNVYSTRRMNRGDGTGQTNMSGSQRINPNGNIGMPQFIRAGRSAYIGYTTNRDMLKPAPIGCNTKTDDENHGWFRYRSYTQRDDVINAVKRSDPAIADQIGEFSIVKEDGIRYNYGLPVYTRDEFSLRYGLKGVAASAIDDNYLAYHYAPRLEQDGITLVGQESAAPYASSFLLTEILSPDYVDRTNNGPTEDDLGGYVRFNYKRVAGSWNKSATDSASFWYRWRTPYNGLQYQRNSFSDPTDDVGTVSGGFKELYYLESIETKTHKAVFATEERNDGYEAHHDEKTAATSATAKGAKRTHRLKTIELFSKNATGKQERLLATVNLEHTYDLCKGVLNGANSTTGKLTLKKLWFEYDGVKSADIAPYEFGYAYRPVQYYIDNNIPKTGPGGAYEQIANYAPLLVPSGGVDPQNPDYSFFNADRWGYYQKNGRQRYDRFIPWVDQTPDADFDPAAWQLKWIKLPSGGEIQVQYEQDDYRYVQHVPAMAMVTLLDDVLLDVNNNKIDNAYRIDVADELGLDLITDVDNNGYPDELENYERQLKQYYIGLPEDQGGSDEERKDKEHTYFRFLYALEGNADNLDHCNVEYLTGYAKVNNVLLDGNELWVVLGDVNNAYTLPDKICENYVRTQRGGIIRKGSCDAATVGIPETKGEDDAATGWEAMLYLLGDFGPYYSSSKNCLEINADESYLRLPMPESRAKRGGGIRVKRVLTMDKGLEGANDAALYGTEYFYEAEDGGSSGVATNEPMFGREENGLVNLIDKRSQQNGYEKIFAGEDREQHEGPLGESIMPNASVGYSRVVAKSIHTGKTGMGYTVSEFHTARDYPFDLGKSTDLAVRSLGTARTGMQNPGDIRYDVAAAIFNYTFSSLRRAQGFRFVIYDAHGKPKREASCVGEYVPGKESSIVEETRYEYFKPGEKIPVMFGSSIDDTLHSWLGKQMEIVYEGREVSDNTFGGTFSYDFGLGLYGGLVPAPFGSGTLGGGLKNESNYLTTFTATKLVRYPVVQKQVTVTKDGITDTSEYVAFDRISGKPVLVKTADGYDDLQLTNSIAHHDGDYYSHSIPAPWVYKGMGQKASSERAVIYSDNANDGIEDLGLSIDMRYDKQGSAESYYLIVHSRRPGAESVVREIFSPGDFVNIFSGSPGNDLVRYGLYHIGNIAGSRVQLLPTSISWRMTEAEENGVNVEIVRSGRGNMLNATVGGLTTYSQPPLVVKHPQ